MAANPRRDRADRGMERRIDDPVGNPAIGIPQRP